VSAGVLSGGRAFGVFACFAGAYFMSYGLRSVNAVIAPDLLAQFGLTNAQLGSLSSAYFLSFAAMQLPLGIWLDRFGARRTDAVLLVIAALGCAVFALADGLPVLWIGRALVGVGVAGALMSALKGYRFWYPAPRQQSLAAWMLVAGTLGALSVTVPVQAALPVVGWRGIFWIAAALVLAAAIALWFGVPRDEERSLSPPAGNGAIWLGYAQVFASAHFWRYGLVAIIVLSSFMSMQTLWAGPWFVQVLGLDARASARALFAFNFVLMLSFLALGAVLPRLERAGWSVGRLIPVVVVAVIGVETAIALYRVPSAWMLWLLLAVVATPLTAVQPFVSLGFPQALTGRAYTAFNLLTFSSAFANQWLFGVVVDAFKAGGADAAHAFGRALLTWQGPQLAVLAALLFWRTQAPSTAGDVHRH